MRKDEKLKMGDEAPKWFHMIIVLLVTVVLIALSWLTWFKFGWFH